MRRALFTIATMVVLFGCGVKYYSRNVSAVLPKLVDTPCDFKPYYQGARNILHGKSPFLADGYIYPPLLAFALTPLAPLDYVTARRTWYALSQIFLLAAAVLLWRWCGSDRVAACSIALVWAFGGAGGEAFGLGQVDALLTLLVVLAMTRQRAVRGTAIAAGFAIKLFPGLLGVAVLLQREKRTIAWMALSALVALVLPWAAVASFLQGPSGVSRGDSWLGTPATLSWSLPSVVLRAMDPPHRGYALPHNWDFGDELGNFVLPAPARAASLATAIVTAGVGLYALLRAMRYRLNKEQTPWGMAALVALALAASPISWTHYQMLQYPGVALLLTTFWRARRWAWWAAALALASLLYPVPVGVLGQYYLRYHAWTAYSPATLYVWTSVTPLASLCLFALFLTRTAHPRGVRL